MMAWWAKGDFLKLNRAVINSTLSDALKVQPVQLGIEDSQEGWHSIIRSGADVGLFISGVGLFPEVGMGPKGSMLKFRTPPQVPKNNLALRSDMVLNGGRSGQLVKNLTGPANSVIKGNSGRIFITNDAGEVIWDITKSRAKSVIPGRGFGSKVMPTQNQLNLLKLIWGD